MQGEKCFGRIIILESFFTYSDDETCRLRLRQSAERGFRAKTVSLAASMGLVGMVQNRPDNRVLVIAEGEKAVLERFAEALHIENTYCKFGGT